MDPSAAVLVCALGLLGRSHANAPIVLLPSPPPHASPNVEAFVQRDRERIYLITSSEVFREASNPRSPDRQEACRKIASIIVHEEWHLAHGGGERDAYLAQLTTLQMLGATPETIGSVRKSMMAVTAQEQPRSVSLRPTSSSASSLDVRRTDRSWPGVLPLPR
ncbi:MAG TPA: hypothetical protein VL173_13940 [Vicinamibacterales bacterium]|jgi:hypothetical protein|nr:hypothetical protein [Vicinamibacterales bacterium]